MKLQFERIEPGAGSSFRVIHATGAEPCRVFWHHHPEYEIVFIPVGQGRRHIGNSIGHYDAGDLVFIGPNLPHLNFSYGHVGDAFEEVVVQLRADFMGDPFLNRPELATVRRLFERSHTGLLFGPETRQAVTERMMQLPGQPPFDRLLTLLQVLHIMATASDSEPLHADGVRFELNPKEQARIDRICQYVETHYAEPIDIRAVADLANLTIPAFSRYFKRMTHLTFTDFVNEYRISQAQRLLHSARTIADISMAVGFTNLSHFNKTFRESTGQTPGIYRRTVGLFKE
jgi:AraC-like DNA-binding protein/quercetin dioxygenase-like cupin family protein